MKKILMRHPLFAGIDLQDLNKILSCMESREQHFPKGSFIFLADESYPRLGILLKEGPRSSKRTYMEIR